MRSVRTVATAIMLVAAACGNQESSKPVAGSSSDSPISISGNERISWNQTAADPNEASRYQYTAYVDAVPFALIDAVCQNSDTATVFTCIDRLPPMSAGSHRIEIAASDVGLEGAHSSPIYVNVVPMKAMTAVASGAASRVITTSDGTYVTVETVATGLDAPSALAATADGRIFIAQAAGTVSVWQGRLVSAPAAMLSDVQRAPAGVGLVGMTLHPEFATNHQVYVAYVGRSRGGALVNRIVRFRELANVLGEGIAILEDPVTAIPPSAPRIRFGPDKKLYVAFPAADWSIADSYASYAGKVLRLNEDGTTPRDNPRSSPVVSTGHVATGGFDWQPNGGRFWMTERDRHGRDVLGSLSSGSENAVAASFAVAIDPAGTAFYHPGVLSAFAGDLFIAGLAGQQLRRVHFDPNDATRIESTERLFDGEYGRLSDVIAGADGTLYVSTSNRGTTLATAQDDRLLKLIPGKPPGK